MLCAAWKSGQIEEQDFGVFCGFDGQHCFVTDCGAIALIQFLAIELDSAAGDLQPAVTSFGERVGDFVAGPEQRDVQLRVLIDHFQNPKSCQMASSSFAEPTRTVQRLV